MAGVTDYTSQLQALLPPGAAWSREPDADLTKLLTALAEEFARADQRTTDLRDEADPYTTLEMLSDWERIAGLPDSCAGAMETLQKRRSALLAKLTSVGGQSRAYFVALAASLGYAITITEFRQFRVGASRCGDPLCGDDWRFVWRVTAQDFTLKYFRVGSSAVGEPLRMWGNDILECAIRRVAPAHTQVVFGYLETQGGLDVVLGGESVTIGGQTVNVSGVL